MAALILFYSDHCQYCGMLISNVKRVDPDQTKVRLVCIDHIRVSPRIHTVPALMLLPSKELLFGRAAMDYLLLPSRGALVGGTGASGSDGPVDPPRPSPIQAGAGAGPSAAGDPMAFAFALDATSMYESLEASQPPSAHGPAWETVGDMGSLPPSHPQAAHAPHASSGNPRLPPSMGVGEETRSAKALPDIDALRAQRDLDF